MLLFGSGTPLTSRQAFAQLAITEVLFDPIGVNTGRQLVEIRNMGSTEVDMGASGFWLYFPPARWQFPPGVVIPPGGQVVVHINRPGTNAPTGTDFFTGISGMRNLRNEDSLSLFSTNLFGDPSKLLDFVEWGSYGNGGEDVAVQASLWTPFSTVSVTTLRDGSSIAHDGTGHLASDWCIDGTPTVGDPNDSCSTSFAASPVRLSEVGYLRSGPGQYHVIVELKNTGDVLEDVGGKWITLNNQYSYQFPLGTPDTLVGREEFLVLHLGVDGASGPLDFYTGAGTFRDLSPSDSISFHAAKPFTDKTTVLDFVRWGSAPVPLEDAAVEAGVWTKGDFVDGSDRARRGSIASRGDGKGVARWYIDNTGTPGKENSATPFAPAVMNEVLIDPPGSNTGDGAVELKNALADEPLDVSGYSLCTESSISPGSLRCFTLPSGASIPPGGFLVIRLNRLGPASAGNINSGAFQELDKGSGALFLSLTRNASDPNNLIDYLRWGNGSTFGESLAVQAGIWKEGDSIAVSEASDNSSIAYFGSGDDAESYRIDRTPSLGEDNQEPPRQDPFRRGDCNDDGRVDISDAIGIFGFLFVGARSSLCRDSCDGNNDAQLDISDPVFLLNFLFRGGTEPPAPGPSQCGPDTSLDSLTCSSYLHCG